VLAGQAQLCTQRGTAAALPDAAPAFCADAMCLVPEAHPLAVHKVACSWSYEPWYLCTLSCGRVEGAWRERWE
jgi:hypothetical protein